MEAKERILQKATDLFMRYGIRSITMDEIAAQLGISKKTIYQFFTDKDEMVDGVVENHIRTNETMWLELRGKSRDAVHEIMMGIEETEEMLRVMNPLIMYDLEKHHPLSQKKLMNHLHRFMFVLVKENIQRGIREGLYRSDLNLEIIARHRLESATMCFDQDVFPHSRFRISDVCRELALLFLHGIATGEGKKRIEKYSSEKTKQLSHEKND